MRRGLIVIEAGRETVDATHQHVGFDRVRAPPEGAV